MTDKNETEVIIKDVGYSSDELETIKNTVGADLTDSELKLFLYVAGKVKLNPLLKQIYPLKLSGRMTIMAGIDGLRTIAHRTGDCMGISEPTYLSDKGRLVACTVTVERLNHGERCKFGATAFLVEYANNKAPIWKSKPRVMLAKCAEALALRKGFPADLYGLYTDDEIPPAEVIPPTVEAKAKTKTPEIEPAQMIMLNQLKSEMRLFCVNNNIAGARDKARFLFKQFKVSSWNEIVAMPEHKIEKYYAIMNDENKRHRDMLAHEKELERKAANPAPAKKEHKKNGVERKVEPTFFLEDPPLKTQAVGPHPDFEMDKFMGTADDNPSVDERLDGFGNLEK